MADYYNVTTNTGDAEIAAAIASNNKLAITHIAFGDGNGAVPTPSKSRTSLIREVHRQAVTKYERHPTNANWIVIETIIPSNIGGFWVREIGVIANGKLISHGSHAPFEKVADPTGVSEYRIKFTQNIKDGNVVNITLDQSLIYASQAWVDENYIPRNEIVNNLLTNDSKKPLSGAMGFALSEGKLDKDSNAVSASRLQTPRIINITGQASGIAEFDGSKNIDIDLAVRYATNSDLANNCTGNSNTASRLQTPRIINITGQASGIAEFDGSKNIDIDLAVRYATNSDLAQNAKIAHNALGFEQSWKNRNTIRYPNTTYINSENRTIFVTVTKKNQAGVARIYTSGVEIAKIGGNSTDFHSFSFPVLTHMSYRVDTDSGIEIWSELQ